MALLKKHLGLLIVLAIYLALVAHFFEWFPNGWDQVEYAWDIKASYLPHSPYILFFLAGKLLGLAFAPPVALSLLSAASGLGALCLFYALNLRLFAPFEKWMCRSKSGVPWQATVATGLLGLSFAFVRQAATQEVYMFLTLMVFLSIFLVLGGTRGSLVWGGMAFGAALAVHNASLFILPALAVALLGVHRAGRARGLAAWVAPAVATAGLFVLVIFLLVPGGWEGGRLAYVLGYLRGASPRISRSAAAEPSFLAQSLEGLWHRLFSQDVAFSRQARAASPLGTSVLLLATAALGLVLFVHKSLWRGLLWLVYPLPFLAYEVLLGRNLDYGLYVPFVLPPLCALAAVTVASVPRLRGLGRGGVVVQAIAVGLLLYPSARLYARHWDILESEALSFYSPTTLAAFWVSEHLPADAVVIEAPDEPNANILPYATGRRPAYCNALESIILRSRGRFTPMNLEAYEPLTTATLKALLASGTPVYAFEPDPLARCNQREVDRTAFAWHRAAVIDLGEVERGLDVPESVRRRLPAGQVVLYQCSPRAGPQQGR